MSDTIVYGIASCDQVRKARQWLRDRGIPARFHDFRADGLDAGTLRRWLSGQPLAGLLNRRGQTWRALDSDARASADDPDRAFELLLERPLLIRRPVVEHAGRLLVGFDPQTFERMFSATSQGSDT